MIRRKRYYINVYKNTKVIQLSINTIWDRELRELCFGGTFLVWNIYIYYDLPNRYKKHIDIIGE